MWFLICQLMLDQRMECMLAQRHINIINMSNMSYIGAKLCQHISPTVAQRTNLRWANVVCKRCANGVANQTIPLAQRYHAICVIETCDVAFSSRYT